jgi:hypothetical protein
MKRFFLLLFCFVGSLGFSQNSYHFDYVLVYDVSFQDKNFERLYYVNSKNNDFFTEITYYKDSTHVDFRISDRNKEIYIKSNAIQQLFFKSEFIKIICDDVKKSSNPHKQKTKEYDFVNYKDTLINDKLYYHYAIKSNKSTSYIKRKNIAEYHYLVSKNMPNFLPVLIDATPYEEWKTEKNIPNGVLNTFYMLNFKGEMVYKSELKGFLQQPKSIEFPEDCNPTKLVVKGY